MMMALTEEYLADRAADRGPAGPATDAADTRGQAAVFAAMKLGVVVLHQHLSRAPDTDTLAPGGLTRVNKAMRDIVSHGLIGQELADKALTGIKRYSRQEPDSDIPKRPP